MPYRSLSDLPKTVTSALPGDAQEIYLKAYNNAWEVYGRPEKRRDGASLQAIAARIAWAAVKKVYRKDSSTGKWKRSRARS